MIKEAILLVHKLASKVTDEEKRSPQTGQQTKDIGNKFPVVTNWAGDVVTSVDPYANTTLAQTNTSSTIHS